MVCIIQKLTRILAVNQRHSEYIDDDDDDDINFRV